MFHDDCDCCQYHSVSFFKNDTPVLHGIDKVTVFIFVVDYILRWTTADFKLSEASIKSFLKYPFTPMAIIDLLSILPSLNVINRSFKVLRVLRMIRAMRVLRIFKAMRYSRSFAVIGGVLHHSKDALVSVCILTQAQLGNKIGTSEQYVNRVIKQKAGTIINRTFVKMMEAMGYDVVVCYEKRNGDI